MTPLAAYVLLFLAVGVGFIFVHLVAGQLVRPSRANPEKGTIYECGEPTIGSAWIQFDLRFYVVALLFVIFDVEVAFFFPWAEVFGKANAVRAAAPPRTIEEVNAFAARVNDLATPRGSTSGTPAAAGVVSAARERRMWRKLQTMSRDEFEAYAQLKGDLTHAMRQLGEKGHDGIRSLSEKQLAVLKEQAGKLESLLQHVAEQQRAEAKETVTAIEKLPEAERKTLDKALLSGGDVSVPGTSLDNVIGSLRGRPDQVASWLAIKPLAELRKLPRGELEMVLLSNAQWKALEKALPQRVRALRELAIRQVKEVSSGATATLTALSAAGTVPAGTWDAFPPRVLAEFAKMTPDKLKAFQALTPEGLVALETPLAEGARTRANSLAWLALIEILVFFGVLLVGFAYLWRRGDLAWVRSTAAEEKDEGARMKDEVRMAV